VRLDAAPKIDVDIDKQTTLALAREEDAYLGTLPAFQAVCLACE